MNIEARLKDWGADVEASIKGAGLVLGVKEICDAVEKGIISVFEVLGNGVALGLIFVRYDGDLNGESELVIMFSITAVKTDVSILSVLGVVYEQIAKKVGLKVIRVHSTRRGADKLLEADGYEFIESVFKKRLE